MIRPPQLCVVWQDPLMKHGKDKVLKIILYGKAKGSQVFQYSLAIQCPFIHTPCLDANRSYILICNRKVGPLGHKNNHIQSITE